MPLTPFNPVIDTVTIGGRPFTLSALPSGIVRYEAYPLSLGVQWQPRPHFSLALSAGAALGQDYRFEDRNGRLLRASRTQSPGLGTLELIYGF